MERLATLLTVLFVALKLTGVITWSWWWVLAPAWFSLACAVVLMLMLWFVLERAR